MTRYPPSLAYILLTLGVDLLLLALFAGIVTTLRRWAKPLFVFGQTALFFYPAHLYLYALMGLTITPTDGTSFGWIYAYWASGHVLLYLSTLGIKSSTKRRAKCGWRLF